MSSSALAGKVVVLTGASSGIGEAIAKHLASLHASLVLGARRGEELERVTNEIQHEHGIEHALRLRCQVTDVKDKRDVSRLVQLAQAEFGYVDAFISNAGIAWIDPMETVNTDHWDDMIDINVRGVLHGIAAALPAFLTQQKEQGRTGHFITILSTSGIKILPGQAVYAGTKNCVRTILESLRQESQGRYKVTEVSPGLTMTNFGSQMDPAIVETGRKRMAEMGMNPFAIAKAVAFALLQSDDVDVNSIVVRPSKQD